MPRFFYNPKPPAVIQETYYVQNKKWSDYVYQGIHGLKQISVEYKVPLSLLIARMKKGWSLHEAATYGTRVNMSDVIAHIKVPIPNVAIVPPEKENSQCKRDFGTYTVKVYQQGQSLPFPDKMSPLWRLALGLCPTR